MGKKISIPKDVMMEELNLQSNRGSRMFQERLKRVERFTLENQVNDLYVNVRTHTHTHTQPCISPLDAMPFQCRTECSINVL